MSEMLLVVEFGEIWMLKKKTKISNCTQCMRKTAASKTNQQNSMRMFI